jgi:hypothetical protein
MACPSQEQPPNSLQRSLLCDGPSVCACGLVPGTIRYGRVRPSSTCPALLREVGSAVLGRMAERRKARTAVPSGCFTAVRGTVTGAELWSAAQGMNRPEPLATEQNVEVAGGRKVPEVTNETRSSNRAANSMTIPRIGRRTEVRIGASRQLTNISVRTAFWGGHA